MDAFEGIVANILEKDGFWVQKSVKVFLTPMEKSSLGKKSIPTPEIDLVAFNSQSNTIVLIEVKSYLDSTGVKYNDLIGQGRDKDRYRLLNNEPYRKLITKKLKLDFIERKLINESTKPEYGLAAGNVYHKDRAKIEDYLRNKKYHFYSPEKIRESVKFLGGSVYLNDPTTITVKLLRPYLQNSQKSPDA